VVTLNSEDWEVVVAEVSLDKVVSFKRQDRAWKSFWFIGIRKLENTIVKVREE